MKIRNSIVAVVCLIAVGPVSAAKTITYYYVDPQGTVLATADQNGNILDSSDHKPYGQQALGSPVGGPEFTGHVVDDELGFVYMQQRFYDPSIGRFVSADPAPINAAKLHNFARYAYANNNPYLFVDPDGREASLYWSSANNVTATVRYTAVGQRLPFSPTAMVLNTQQRLSGLVNINGTIVNLKTVVRLDNSGSNGVTTLVTVPDTGTVTQSGRPETNKIGGDIVTLGSQMSEAYALNAASHEIAHVAGPGDQYKGGVDVNGKTLTSDVPGDPNLMKDLTGAGANDQTLREVIEAPTNTNSCAQGVHAPNGGC